MKNLLVLVVLAGLAWFGYRKLHAADALAVATTAPASPSARAPLQAASDTTEIASNFHCDGRTMCPQMTSCEEATFFVQHCPDTKMDGNHDGVPCERQWCN